MTCLFLETKVKQLSHECGNVSGFCMIVRHIWIIVVLERGYGCSAQKKKYVLCTSSTEIQWTAHGVMQYMHYL